MFRRGEEIGTKVERGGRAGGFEPHPVLAGDVGEPARDIRPAGEHNSLDLRADRRQRGAGLLAAIEDRRAVGLGRRLARRLGQGTEPAGPDVNAGFGGAQKHDRAVGTGGGSQRADCMGERMDDDDRRRRLHHRGRAVRRSRLISEGGRR